MNRAILKCVGIDVDDGLNRFMGDELAYSHFLKNFLTSKLYDQLKVSIKNKQIEDAFNAAHNLKGLAAMLSLGDFYDLICEITEMLRKKELPDEKFILKTDIKYKEVCKAISES